MVGTNNLDMRGMRRATERQKAKKTSWESQHVRAVDPKQKQMLLTLAFCTIVAFLPTIKAYAVTPSAQLATTSYQDLVDTLIDSNLFKLSANDSQVQVNDIGIAQLIARVRDDGDSANAVPCGPWSGGNAATDAAIAECRKAINSFADKSFLRGDMADATSPVWRYDNTFLVGTTPGARTLAAARVAGPNRQIQIGIEGDARQFVVEGRANGRVFAVPLGTGAMHSERLAGGRAPAAETADPPQLLCLPMGSNGERCQDELAVIHMPGYGVILRIPRQGSTIGDARSAPMSITIDGQHKQTRLDNPVFAPLRPNQTVQINKGRVQAQFQIVERAVDLGELPAMAGIAAAVRAARPRGDVQTSIRRDVHIDAQRALDELLAAPRSVSVRATATFMDGWTGAIVALPSFPHREEQLGTGAGERQFRQGWLTTNMAMVPLVVGSVAKVPFAAALLKTYPELGDPRLRIASTEAGAIGKIKGIERRRNGRQVTVELRSNGQPVTVENLHDTQSFGFVDFIARSNNYFALAMMERGSGAERVQEWAEEFWKLNCGVATAKSDAASDDRYGGWLTGGQCAATLWPDIDFARPQALRAAEIDPVSLNLGDAYLLTNNYPDYYINVLGSGRSLWSTIGLAQAFSRIVTRHQVNARFTHPGQATPPPLLSKDETANQYQPLLDGMQHVVRRNYSGTASALQDVLSNRYSSFDVYAKTGTFEIAASAAADRYPCISWQLRAGDSLLVRETGAPGVLRLTMMPATRCPRGQGSLRDDLDRLNANSEDVAAFVALRSSSTGGIRTMPTLTRAVEGAGKALVLVFQCTKMQSHVRTIAINIQARDSNDMSPAINYAKNVLERTSIRNWITRGC